MELRDATPDDALALGEFRCAQTDQEYDLEVEQWVREAFDRQHEWAGSVLRVAVDEEGVVCAVVLYEPFDPPPPGFYLTIGAVAVEAQGRGVGSTVLRTLIHDLAQQCPGGLLMWRVHEDNRPCQALWESLGYSVTLVKRDHAIPGYLTYKATLPDGPALESGSEAASAP